MAQKCPTPLLDESLYPNNNRASLARFCQTIGNSSCCLPCPISDWRYPRMTDLVDSKHLLAWCALGVMPFMILLLITFMVLPKETTDRHYLTTIPILAIIIINLAWLMTFSSSQKYCQDPITPGDISSDSFCGPSMSLLLLGCFILLISCFFRSVALHIFVCWEVKPGRLFRIISLTVIFVGSVAFVAIALTMTGLAYEYGKICYLLPNHDRETLWVPVLAISVSALFLQLITMTYCSYIVVKSLLQDRNLCRTDIQGSLTLLQRQYMVEMKQASMRVKNIVQMQWHPTVIVVIILIYSIYLASVLMRQKPFVEYDPVAIQAWFSCLSSSNGDKQFCMPLADGIGPDQSQFLVAMTMLALSGVPGTIISSRLRMYRGWTNYIKQSRQFNESEVVALDNFDFRVDEGDVKLV